MLRTVLENDGEEPHCLIGHVLGLGDRFPNGQFVERNRAVSHGDGGIALHLAGGVVDGIGRVVKELSRGES